MSQSGQNLSPSGKEEMVCPDHRKDPDRCWALITCPYSDSNEKHHVDAKNFPEHLRNCRRDYCSKNASSIKFVRCKHDSRHHVPEIEIGFHEKICDDYLYRHIVSAISKQPNPLPDNYAVSDASSSDISSCSELDSEDDSDDNFEVSPTPASESDTEDVSSLLQNSICEKELV